MSELSIEINKIYLESNLDTMKRMPDGFVDMVITSPPYNVGNNNMTEEKYQENIDKKSKEEYESWLCEIIDELLRVTKKHIFFNIQMLSHNKQTVLKIMGKYHDKIKDIIIWSKNSFPPAIEPGVMNSKFEFIIIFSNDRPEKRKFYDGTFQGTFTNVIEGNNASQNIYSKIHKATYPLYLPRTILNNFGISGGGGGDELIYDPFMGTGTTAIAALMEKRNFIGSEIDADYFALSNKRIKEHLSQPTLF